jgi:multimeric flavodoxin WrbA
MSTHTDIDLDFGDLSAVFLNCTLKRSPEPSNTQALMDNAAVIMRAHGVQVDTIRVADHVVPPGVQEDMTAFGAERDDWPAIQRRILAAEILVIGTPIWLGAKSSVCTSVVERLYGYSGELNDRGQWIYYGRTGGVVVTGNEDGIKHVAMETLYSLQHLGFVVPPQADCGWIGEAGPGPSYADEDGGRANDFTRRNTAFMAWNLMHTARMLKRAGGIPAYGNQRAAWDAGARFDHPNPEYR